MNAFIEWGALAQVLVAGVLVGAGIPALFALGLRLLAGPTPGTDEAGTEQTVVSPAEGPVTALLPRPGPARLAGAVLCLAVVVGAIVTGLAVVVSGGH